MAELQTSLAYSMSENSNYGNNTTSFGLPGNGGRNPSYCSTEYTGTAYIYDDKTAKLDIKWVFHSDWTIVNNLYPAIFYLCKTQFTIGVSNGYPTVPSPLIASKETTIYVTNGTFYWSDSMSGQSLGSIDSLQTDSDGNGVIWIGGTGNYYVAKPTYPASVKLLIPGWVEAISQPEDYFPFEIYLSGEWKSCNRDGGAFQQYQSNSWVNYKNTEGDSSASTCFYYTNSAWNILPRIGAE